METKSKNFYFQEMNCIVSFPCSGNEGRKYLFYSVQFMDRKNKQIKDALVADIVESPMFENWYPHTVGFFISPANSECNFEGNFLELRIVRCIEEFWKFLNDLNL